MSIMKQHPDGMNPFAISLVLSILKASSILLMNDIIYPYLPQLKMVQSSSISVL